LPQKKILTQKKKSKKKTRIKMKNTPVNKQKALETRNKAEIVKYNPRVEQKTRRRIEELVREKKSVRDIALLIPSVSKSVIGRIRKEMNNINFKNKGGRKEIFTEREKKKVVKLVGGSNGVSARKVPLVMLKEHSIKCSDRTIRRVLKEKGLKAKKKIKKPSISKKNQKERMDFCITHRDWTIEDWNNVIWSDETKINRFGSDGIRWSWVKPNEILSSKTVIPTVKHGGGSLMVWGCFNNKGIGNLCRIDGKMDSVLYKQILEEDLVRSIEEFGMEKSTVIFQHDNDPKHTAKKVKSWLGEQEFSVMKWPAQSPDLNPIENLWSILKSKLMEYDSSPNGMIELWERIQEKWNEIDAETCQKLVNSMPRRIEAVIKAKGLWTKY
jgi:transposase